MKEQNNVSSVLDTVWTSFHSSVSETNIKLSVSSIWNQSHRGSSDRRFKYMSAVKNTCLIEAGDI